MDNLGLRTAARTLADLPVPVITLSARGRILYGNRTALHELGSIVGMSLRDAFQAVGSQQDLAVSEIVSRLALSPVPYLTDLCFVTRVKGGASLARACYMAGPRRGQLIAIFDTHSLDLPLAVDRVFRHAGAHTALDDVLWAISEEARALANGVRAYVKIFDRQRDVLVYKALSTVIPGEAFLEADSPVSRGITGRVFSTRTLYYSPDLHSEPPGTFLIGFSGTRSKLVLPLIPSQSESVDCYGVLAVDSEAPHHFSPYLIQLLSLFAGSAAIAVALKEVEQDARQHLAPILQAHFSPDALKQVREAIHTAKNLSRTVVDQIDALRDGLGAGPGSASRAKTLDDKIQDFLAVGDVFESLLTSLPERGPKQSDAQASTTSLRKAIEQASRLIPFATHGIRFDLSADLDPDAGDVVDGRAMDWLVVFFTLLSNAYNAMKSSAKEGEVRVVLSRSPLGNELLRIVVEDEGPGLPKWLTEALRQGKAGVSRTPGGSGYGVLSARETIMAHGGTVQLDAPFGRGTRYIIDLPYAPRRKRVERKNDRNA